jgi:hypothetical protein
MPNFISKNLQFFVFKVTHCTIFTPFFSTNDMTFHAFKMNLFHSYDILGAGMLWKPKKARKFVKIRENLLKFIKSRAEECFDKVLNEEFKKNLMCKMKNVITRIYSNLLHLVPNLLH